MFDGKSILVVDDEPDLREILSDEFQALGASVDTAPNGKVAWEKAQAREFELVISDLRMPGGDGVALAKELKREAEGAPTLVLMTGFADLTGEEAYAIGAEGFVTKPFLLDKFRENLQRLMTPPRQRWKLEKPIEGKPALQVDDSVFANRARATYLGRGGLFIPGRDLHVRIGQELSFRAAGLEGTAIVRWVRSFGNNEEPGVGLEFTGLTEASLDRALDAIAKDKPRAYIPLGF